MIEIIGMGSVLTSLHISPPGADHARSLRHVIDELSDLRHDILVLHETSHQAIEFYQVKSNYTASVVRAETLQLLADPDRLAASLADRAPVSTAPMPWLMGTAFSSQSGSTGTPVQAVTPPHPDQCPTHRAGEQSGPRLLLTFPQNLLSTDRKAALLRFVDGILTVLRLLLALVMTALSRHPDVLAFLLVMLAVCLRYGHREEPDDHAFLPRRLKRMSMGSCPHA